MNRTGYKWTATVTGALLLAGCATYPDADSTRQMAERMVHEGFSANPSFAKRLEQDRSQQICSKIGEAKLTQEEAAEVVKLARASIRSLPKRRASARFSAVMDR